MTDPTVHDARRGSAKDPAIDQYLDDLLLALRMKDVPGERIGAILAEARTHLADGNEDPYETFGTPADYAASLTADAPPRSRRDRAATFLGTSCLVLGLWWVIQAGSALITREQAALSAGPVVIAIVAALAAPLLVEKAVTGSRAVFYGCLVATLVVLAVLAAANAWIGAQLSVPVPGLALLGCGVVLLVAGTLGVGGRSSDVVVEPLEPAESVRVRRRRDTAVVTLTPWFFALLGIASAVATAALLN